MYTLISPIYFSNNHDFTLFICCFIKYPTLSESMFLWLILLLFLVPDIFHQVQCPPYSSELSQMDKPYIHHVFPTQLPADVRADFLHWPLCKVLEWVWKCRVKQSLSREDLIPFGCISYRELLGHTVVLVLMFGETSIPLCIKTSRLCILTLPAQGSSLSIF